MAPIYLVRNARQHLRTFYANFPLFSALNELLREFGIALGESVLEGYFDMGSHGMYYASGTSLIRFPQIDGAIIIERDLHDQGLEVSHASVIKK